MLKRRRSSESEANTDDGDEHNGFNDGDEHHASTDCGAEDMDFESDLDIKYDYDLRFFSPPDGVAALGRDILTFQIHAKVPEDLDWHVSSSEDDQKKWYEELLKAWTESKPKDPKEASKLVYDILRAVHPYHIHIDDYEGFLYFYGLPYFSTVPEPTPSGEALPDASCPLVEENASSPDSPGYCLTPLAEEDVPAFELVTLPVLRNRVTDGARFTASVVVNDLHFLPLNIVSAVLERRRALAKGDRHLAREMLNHINTTQDYEVVDIDNHELLTKKYEIRLRGIRAPKIGMQHGTEAKDELTRMLNGKCLRISVYYVDDSMHCFGDVYHCSKCLQDILLQKGATLPYWEEDEDAVSMEKEPLQ